MKRIEIPSIKFIEQAAKDFLNYHKERKFFLFYGELGSGKTTFIKALCKKLKVIDNVTSPSFSIINEYHTKDNKIIYHFDFYRIKQLEEVFDLGYEEYFYCDNYCFIEWPEKIEEILPEEIVRVKINIKDNSTRVLEMD
jgi:tRNA threonylcarbamoyladenosine biosynthesis protein TsaE